MLRNGNSIQICTPREALWQSGVCQDCNTGIRHQKQWYKGSIKRMFWCSHSALCGSWGWVPLGSIRPDLYQLPEEPSEWTLPHGSAVRLWFALRYQQEREQLVVSLLRAANLPALCQGNATLVKLQLLPSDDRRHRQAKARRKGCHPQFNDTFVFQVKSFSW